MIGKDILKFHTVFWPAMLMAADLEVPEHVFVHGFLLGADGRKMSKSLGNVLDPFEVMDAFGTDALRFYLMRDVSFGGDGAVGDGRRSGTRYETELANEIRQPGQPHDRDDPALPRRCGPRRATRPGARQRIRRPARARVGAARSRRDDARAGADLAARAAPEPLRRGAGAVAAGQGPRRARTSWTRRSPRSPRGCGRWRCCCVPTCRRASSGCSRRSARPSSTFEGAAFGPRGGRTPCSRWSRCSPSSVEPTRS